MVLTESLLAAILKVIQASDRDGLSSVDLTSFANAVVLENVCYAGADIDRSIA